MRSHKLGIALIVAGVIALAAAAVLPGVSGCDTPAPARFFVIR